MDMVTSNRPEIPDTGLKGFLKWLQREDIGLYKAVAPRIAKAVPRGFSDYTSSKLTNMRKCAGRRSQQLFGTLGDNGLVDISFDPDSVSTTSYSIDTSDAANTGASSSGIMNTVGSILNGVMQAGLAFNQLQTAKQVTQMQLQRAQAGLPPLNIDMSKMGVPSVSVGLAPGTSSMLMYGGLLLAGLWLFSSLGKRSAR